MCVFSTQVATLHQEVSELTKGLHHMMNLLQTHISANHRKASFPSCVPTGFNTSMPVDPTSAFCLHTSPASLKAPNQSSPASAQWSCSEAAKPETQSRQSSSLPSNSCLYLSSAPKLGLCHSSESMTSPQWTCSSPHSPYYCGGLSPHGRHEDSRPLGASPSSISQSHPTLCLQPPSDGDELSFLLSSTATGSSIHSPLDALSSSHSHVNMSQTSNEALHTLSQDASIFQMKDSHTFICPISSSSTLLCKPASSSFDPGSIQLDILQPSLPLGSSPASKHTSLDCLLGNRESTESRDGASSRRSSIGVQPQSTNQSWCLDFTD